MSNKTFEQVTSGEATSLADTDIFAVQTGTPGSRITQFLKKSALRIGLFGTASQGDILYYNGSDWTRLAAGTAGQVLRTEGAAANPTFGYPADLTITSAAQGDVLYFNGTHWVRLAASTAGMVLRTEGAAANPTFGYPANLTIASQTAGDFLYYTGSAWIRVTGVPARGQMINGKLATSVASNNLTLAIKTLAGNDPSASDPVIVRIGDNIRILTAALSVTAAAATNWCNLGAAETATQDTDLFVYLGYNATDGVTLGFSRIAHANFYGDFSTTSTNEKYCRISTITTAANTDVYEVVGRFNAQITASASFNWSIPATSIVISKPIYVTRYLTWAPTWSGNGSMTLSSISTALAQYQINYNTASYAVAASMTTGGTANAAILGTTPFSHSTNLKGGCNITDTSSNMGGAYLFTSGTIAFRRYDAANWTLAAARAVGVSISVPML